MTPQSRLLALFAALLTVSSILQLLRRRQLREKYAVLWLVLSAAVVGVAAFPQLLTAAAQVTGVQVPSNLLFFVAILVQLVVSVQLSWEVSRLEDETRALAEEVALVHLRVDQAEAAQARRAQPDASAS